MIDIIPIVLPVFLVVALGFSLRGTGLVDADFLYQLNRLIYYVALPALLFYKIAAADFSASFNPMMLVGMVLAITLVFGLSYLYGAVRNYPVATRGAFCQGSFRGNCAYIGLAIVFNAYGEEGFAIAGIILGFLVPLFNFLAVVALQLPQNQGRHKLGSSFWIHQIALNPLIIASFVGVLWSSLGNALPVVLERSLAILTGMSLPLALIAIGASFSPEKLKGEMVKAGLAVAIKIIGMPLLAALILHQLGVSSMELGVGVLLAASPTATASYIMAQQLKSDAELTGSIIMLSTLLSVFSYTICLYVLKLAGI